MKNCKFKKIILNLKFWMTNMINTFWINNHYEFINFYSWMEKEVSPSNNWFESGKSTDKKSAAAAVIIADDMNKWVKKINQINQFFVDFQ